MDIDPPDPATLNPSKMRYRDLQKACKAIGLPASGSLEVLRARVQEYVNDPQGVLERLRLTREEEKNRKREAKQKWVDWKKHPAKEILMEDLERGGWMYGLEWDAGVVFEVYQATHEEFKDVPFEQFEVRYNEATKTAAKRRARSAQELEWLEHDRLLHPRQSHNHRGDPVFDMDIAAKEQLRDDIKNKLHEQMTPMEFWQSREVYTKYKLDKFRPRIYQEVRRGKMLNWLEKKRTEKRTAYMAKNKPESVTYNRN
jgi:hypothetical protein